MKRALSILLTAVLLCTYAQTPILAADPPGEIVTAEGWKLKTCTIRPSYVYYYDQLEKIDLFTLWQRENSDPSGDYYIYPFTDPPIEQVSGSEALQVVGITPGMVTWSVSDESVARLEPGANEFEAAVVGTGLGQVTITATVSGFGSFDTLIEIRPNLHITPKQARLDIGKTLQLQAKWQPASDPPPVITWIPLDMLVMQSFAGEHAAILKERDRKIAEGANPEEAETQANEAINKARVQNLTRAIESAPNIATIDADGLVTGLADGHLLIGAIVENDFQSIFGMLDTMTGGDLSTLNNVCQLTVGNPDELPDVVIPKPEQPKPLPPPEKPKYKIVTIGQAIAEFLVMQILKPLLSALAPIGEAVEEFFEPLIDWFAVNLSPMKSITLSPKELTLYVNESHKLDAALVPENNSKLRLRWSSSNNAVAKVNSSGKITAQSAGTAIITCRADDGSAVDTCIVTVKNRLVESIVLEDTEIYTNETGRLNIAVLPHNATNRAVTYTSSNPGVASVNNKGVITGKTPGTVDITVRSTDGSGVSTTGTITVKQRMVERIALSSEMWVNPGSSGTLRPAVYPSSAFDKSMTYTSSDPAVVSINSSNGAYTARSLGTAVITVQANDGSGVTAQVTITVKPVQVLKVPGGTISFSLQEGEVLYAPDQGAGWAGTPWDTAFSNFLKNMMTRFYRMFPPDSWFAGVLRFFLRVMGFPVDINYRIFTGTASGLFSTASSLMDTVEKAFSSELGVTLVRQSGGKATAELNVLSGCKTGNGNICNTTSRTLGGCGEVWECEWEHHKSGLYFLAKEPSPGSTLALRFVDFPICDSKNGRHSGPGGMVDRLGSKNMIVSTTAYPDHRLEITAHEISHQLGATEVTCGAKICVMKPGTITAAGNTLVWCDGCKNEIKEFIKGM